MRQVKLATVIQAPQEFFVHFVRCVESKTNQVQCGWRHYFEARIGLNPAQKCLGQLNVTPDERLHALYPVMLYVKPQFQCTKRAAQWRVPVAIFEDRI